MCVINIVLNTTTPQGSSIVSSSGRYRKVGTTTWTTFTINLANPKTPNITVLGNYELQVNVTNSLGTTSDYANGSFIVKDQPCS